MSIRVTVDTSDARKLVTDTRLASEQGMRRLRERGEELIEDEAPYERLKEGVTSEDNTRGLPYGKLEARVFVEAMREAEEATTGTLHLPSGNTKEIDLRATRAFNIAKAVIEGTGLYGPRGTVITPKRASMLLIEVDAVRAGESFISARGKTFVVRPRSEGMRPDDFPERAGRRLEGEAEAIMLRALTAAGVTK